MIEVRWHGRGGQGAFTAAKILGAAAVLDGKYALSFPSFGPERRGAPIQAFTKIDDRKISDRTVIKKCDYIIYLDETLFHENAIEDLKEGGHILINSSDADRFHNPSIMVIDADRIAESILHRPVSNTAMLAALAEGYQLTGIDKVKTALSYFLSKKIAEKNLEVVDRIAEIIKEKRSGGNAK